MYDAAAAQCGGVGGVDVLVHRCPHPVHAAQLESLRRELMTFSTLGLVGNIDCLVVLHKSLSDCRRQSAADSLQRSTNFELHRASSPWVQHRAHWLSTSQQLVACG